MIARAGIVLGVLVLLAIALVVMALGAPLYVLMGRR